MENKYIKTDRFRRMATSFGQYLQGDAVQLYGFFRHSYFIEIQIEGAALA